MGNGITDETRIKELEKQLKEIELEQKISEAKKKKAEADKALEPMSEIEKVKKLAEQKKAFAEAKKATLKAELPDLEVKALEGKLTIDDNVAIECQILAYKATSEIAFQISRELKGLVIKRAIIYNQDDLNTVLTYKAFIEQINLLKKQYEKAIEEKKAEIKMALAPEAALVAGTVVKSFIDFASLFKTDTDIKGKKLDITDEALVAEIARALKSEKIETIYPPFINTVSDKLLSNITELTELKEKADQKIAAWSAADQFKDKVAQLKTLNGQYEKILTVLTAIDEKTGISRLEKLIKGEILSTKLDTDGTYILYLKVASAGGNNKITRNLLFSRLSHSGSAIITYFLLDKEGVIKSSKTFYNTTGYMQFKDSNRIEGSNNFNS